MRIEKTTIRRIVTFALRFSGGLTVLILAFLGCALAYRAYRQHENESALAVHSPNGIQESRFVKIGGIEEFILIRGEDRNNPVILLVHGGPGLAQSMLFAWFRPWEKYFTVVQWDQRGAGKTLGRYGKATPNLTEKQMVEDGIQVSEYLRSYLHTDDLILLGHSWGSQLAIQMVAKRPDLYRAYVGTGQAVDDLKAEQVDYDMVLKAAQNAGNAKDVESLTRIGQPPFTNSNLMLTERSIAAAYGPPNEQPMSYYRRSIPAALFAPGFTLRDMWDASYGALYSLRVLAPELSTFDARKVSLDFKVPMFFFQGERDMVTPTSLVEKYMSEIAAPHKELVILKGDGHGALLADPNQFLSALVTHLRPFVTGGPTSRKGG